VTGVGRRWWVGAVVVGLGCLVDGAATGDRPTLAAACIALGAGGIGMLTDRRYDR